LIVNGKNRSVNPYDITTIQLTGLRCLGSCLDDLDTNVTMETFLRYWNTSTDWPSGAVPVAGEDVHIEPAWNMIYDMGDGDDVPIY
jgi:hypothetical protein